VTNVTRLEILDKAGMFVDKVDGKLVPRLGSRKARLMRRF
jgi:hypothetical protein